MKLKTYLRGLGIGIIVTTIVMAIALGGRKETLSDEEIVIRAKQLGMVEGAEKDAGNEKKPEGGTEIKESADAGKTGTEGEKEQPENAESEAGNGDEAQNNAEPEAGKETEPQSSTASGEENGQESDKTEAEEPKEDTDDASAENQTDASDDGAVIAGEMVSVSIVNGDDSATVSKRLEELDLVVSATQFDRFLCDNGYAKRISPGSYEIAIGSSEETIAKIITKSR